MKSWTRHCERSPVTVQDPKAMVQKLWDFCDVLRDDGLSYGDYLEQLTYLLFLKMADEQHVMSSLECGRSFLAS